MLLGYSASGKIVFIKTHVGTCGKVPMKMVKEDAGRRTQEEGRWTMEPSNRGTIQSSNHPTVQVSKGGGDGLEWRLGRVRWHWYTAFG